MLTETLSREAAEQIFRKEAIVMGGSGAEGIPQYRIVELFGKSAADFMEKNIKTDGYLKGGEDYNAVGAASVDRPVITYLYKAGFFKVVAEHNYLITLEKHRASKGGAIVDACRKERLTAKDAADATKRATERRREKTEG